MRVAGQEGIGAPANDGVAERGAGASASGAFTALLALLQGGAVPAEIEQLGAGGAIPDDAAEDDADDAGAGAAEATAADGVVVTLSVASAVAAGAGATTASAAPAAADAAQPGGAGTAGAATIAAFAGDAGGLGGGGSVAGAGAGAFGGAGRDFAQGQGERTADPGIATDAAPTIDGTASATADAPASSTSQKGREGTLVAAAAPGAARTAATGTQPAVAPQAAAAAEADGDAARASAPRAPAATGAGTATGESAATATSAELGSGTDHARATIAPHATTSARAGAATSAQPAGEADADESETGDADAPPPGRGASASAPARDLPAGVRLLTEPAHALDAQARDGAATNDATIRAEGLGIARGDALTGNGAGGGAERVRASGFTAGEAGLPSWVERLSSPEGLAAARRGHALHMDLEPNGLGRIEIRLSLGRDGLRATVIAEHETTRSLLASQQPQLAAALERNDLRLESFLVDVGAHAGGDGREAWRDATDPAAFDQIGMVHVTGRDAALDDPSRASAAPRGLVSVRA